MYLVALWNSSCFKLVLISRNNFQIPSLQEICLKDHCQSFSQIAAAFNVPDDFYKYLELPF